MKCEDFETIMIDYLENQLDNERKLEIEKHLKTCERCLDELMDLQQILRLMSEEQMIKPDDSVRINFYHMLHSEIRKNEMKKPSPFPISPDRWYNRGFNRYAAGLALLICGTFIGLFIYSGVMKSSQEQKLSTLQAEVTELKKTAMFTLLKDESSSHRLLAVSYADEMEAPDDNIVEALIMTLNNDKNVNVRLAAAYALAKFSGHPSVSDSLVKSLSLQTDPILQITLINILVERKEKNAIVPIQQIITDENTLEEVKTIAEDRVKTLI